MFSTRFLIGIGAVVVVLAGVIIGASLLRDDASAELAETIRAVEIPRDLVDGKTMGSDDAPLTLTMYEDFQCPFCLRFTAEDEPVLIDEYVKTGKLKIEFAQYALLGEESVQAAIASECAADQDRFWEYHKELFAKQADEGQQDREVLNDGRFKLETLQELADNAGLDRTEFDACMNSGEKVSVVENQRSEAQSAGLGGTPNFLINGQPLGASASDLGGPDAWRTVMDQLYDQFTGTPSAGPTSAATSEATTAANATPTP